MMFKTSSFIVVFLLIFYDLIFGQTLQDIQKLKSEYEKMKKESVLSEPQFEGQLTREDGQNPNLINLLPFKGNQKDTVDLVSKFFGYDFFTKRDTLGFWENLPVPTNYVLGPGDEVIISLWGETSLREVFTISRSGKIYDEKVGVINLSGKNLKESKSHIRKQYGKIYSTLNSSKPTTFLDISLGSLKSINVNFVGAANFPGVYAIHPFSNLISGLIQAGGVDTTGSLRSIKIKRNNEVSAAIDLYEYLLEGNISRNIQLRDQDIVLIEYRKSSITIDSLVYRPGIYESVQGESIFKILEYSGGLKPDAAQKLSIKRITPRNRRGKETRNNENIYVDIEMTKKMPAQDGDQITVRRMLKNLQEVEMIGQVKHPGKYGFYDGMTLFDLIELGGGFKDSTFWKSVYQAQSEIIRRDPESRYEKIINVDLKQINNDEYFKEIKLHNLDRFVVHSNLFFFEKKNVKINGEVNIPGSYPLIRDNETLQNLIDRAGGLTTKSLENGISIFRDNKDFDNQKNSKAKEYDESITEKTRVAWKSSDITLMPGDSIIVKEKTLTVNIAGEVYNPGLIEFKKNKSVNSYINDAGGITEKGNKNGIVIIYANGVTIPKKWYFSPRITDGCTIIVNQKEESQPFDLTQFATNWTQIASSLITAVVLSQQISSN